MAQPYATAGIEPPLEELLDDPIAHLVMRRDGVELADVWRWVHEARARLAHTAASPAPEKRRGGAAALPPSPRDQGLRGAQAGVSEVEIRQREFSARD
jgi:hypothetical protein